MKATAAGTALWQYQPQSVTNRDDAKKPVRREIPQVTDRQTTAEEVLAVIADSLMISPDDLTRQSEAADFPDAWDSMGTMALLLDLDTRFDLKLEPGQADDLQSVAGILSALRAAGKLP